MQIVNRKGYWSLISQIKSLHLNVISWCAMYSPGPCKYTIVKWREQYDKLGYIIYESKWISCVIICHTQTMTICETWQESFQTNDLIDSSLIISPTIRPTTYMYSSGLQGALLYTAGKMIWHMCTFTLWIQSLSITYCITITCSWFGSINASHVYYNTRWVDHRKI